ncbi:hypothetical protein OSB04_014822 [Centaurea solstitialis]|uniref:TFIIS N-terminal domain-containing protein n=1 Tax=Centaurea solstitialis TaxID=347529 RepID=A0AA38W6T7_9ASTR|nr:hypothetical protein OSB04_014822 [Centaurea solstitialis]
MLYIEEELKKSEAEIMDEWRNNLRSITRNGDVFELIKRAIMVAAFDHPTEFLIKRDEIAQILFSSHHQENNIGCENKMLKEDKDVNNHDGIIYDGDLVHENHMVATTTTDDDEVLRIKHILDDAKLRESDESVVYESLSKLEEMGMCFKTLEATMIGKSVKGFQKHASMDIRQIARRLIKKWRCVADEWIDALEKASSSCVVQQEKEEESKAAEKQMVVKKESSGVVELRITESPIFEKAQVEEKEEEKKEAKVAQKQMVMMKKESSSNVVKLRIIPQEKANMEEEKSATIEKKLEASKRKLHERYEEVESAKRQRKIQVIQPYQLTKKQKQGLILSKLTKSQNRRSFKIYKGEY